MKATHYRRPIWLVMRFERDEDGRDDDCVQVGGFWDQPTAVAEQQRLAVLEKNPDVHYEIIATEAAGVYPNDEAPPWESDPDRWKKRGYEPPATA